MRRYLALFLAIFAVGFAMYFFSVPARAARQYGSPSPNLSSAQVYNYSAKLIWYDGLLTEPLNTNGNVQTFVIEQDTSVYSIAENLYNAGIIRDPNAFVDYLIYSGLDITIKAGVYELSSSQSILDIAHELQDATSQDVNFVILPGWRMEEIAASLPTSGLSATPQEFISLGLDSSLNNISDSLSNEGFFYPDSYVLPRTTDARTLVEILVRNFEQHLTNEIREGFVRQGLSVYQAVILASIVEREAVQNDEAALIASVYINRLNIGMKLDADPTVQYVVGSPQTWWVNPILYEHLQVDSLYNTYMYNGLPPAPISNPSLNSLQAVAFPEQSPYFYFRARCDYSGYHAFSVTYEEQLSNSCN